MNMPTQPKFEDFIPRFFNMLFAPEDRVVICQLLDPAKSGELPGWRDTSHAFRNDAVFDILNSHFETPNIYFRASAHDGHRRYRAQNCVQTRALFIDVDYGTAGHKKPQPFKTLEDAQSYLLSMPGRPTCAWHTGHGIQACFVLDQPYLFGRPGSLQRYTSVSSKLSRMAMADATFTPEHAFRVPLTLNDKRWMDPSAAPIRGELLWCDERMYSFAQLADQVAQYGIDEHVAQAQEEARTGVWEDNDLTDTPYPDLPDNLRQDIEARHQERSTTMFRIVGRMVRMGYSDRTIVQAIQRGPDFVDKYGSRVFAEAEKCLAKIRDGKYVYGTTMAPRLKTYNVPVTIDIDSCDELEPTFERKLDRYAEINGFALSPRVRTAARFHNHMFKTYRSGVLESPCGAGKSTWAFCHIALHAGPTDRYIYVTETVDALYRAADAIQSLTETPVGRVHGFNEAQCQSLCGHKRTWRDCQPRDSRSVCHACNRRVDCAFFNRQVQEDRAILCMTHSGLMRALEDGRELLEDANIIVDESLNPFSTWEVQISDLKNLKAHISPDIDLGKLFPYSTVSHTIEHRRWGLGTQVDTFSRRNYVFRDERQTAGITDVYNQLRACLANIESLNPFKSVTGVVQRARDTLSDLLSFFHPSMLNDATYAFHEVAGKEGLRLVVKRNRFDLGTRRKYRRLWMLNASAQLCPYAYPDGMAVYTCPDIPENSNLVAIRVVRGNPTTKRAAQNTWLGYVALMFGNRRVRHNRIVVATNKSGEHLETVRAQLEKLYGPGIDITHLARGRIKGENIAGDCTLVCVASMATFTTIDDCALHAALQVRRTYPDRPLVYTESGDPNWPGGRFQIPAMRQYFALRSLDEAYQTIWRGAVRNDLPTEAVIAVPDPDWIVALLRTVMPGARLGACYKVIDEDPAAQAEWQDTDRDRELAALVSHKPFAFADDEQMTGLQQLISVPPGTEIKKLDVAGVFGYEGAHRWKDNKHRIMRWIGDFFESGSTNRLLRRRDLMKSQQAD
ncbi:MAG: hypothetical protein ISS31_09800 [Kiritimatiellae bacterium]|nr:hypothetical protein [Kiritimatiellia bacterium]